MTTLLIFLAINLGPPMIVDTLVFGTYWWRATLHRWRRGY